MRVPPWAQIGFGRAPRLALERWRRPLALAPGGGAVLAVAALGFGAAAYYEAPWESPAAVTLASLMLGLCVGAVMLWRARSVSWRVAGLIMALGALGFAWAQASTHARATPMLDAPAINAIVTGWVERIDPPATERQAHVRRYVIRLNALENAGASSMPLRVRITAPQGAAQMGDIVRWRARLQAPPGAPLSGAYDPRRRFYFEGLGASGRLHEPMAAPATLALGPQEALLRQVARARAHVAHALEDWAGPATGPIVAALVTGWRGDIPPDTSEALRIAGLGHILAISGLHMALVAGGVYGLAALALASWERAARGQDIRRWAAVIALIAATAYLIFSGASVSTQRAYVMGGAAFLAIILQRRALSLRTLASAAVVVVALRPESAVSPGFHLSFAAAGALITAYGVVERRWRAETAPRGAGLRGAAATLIWGSVITSVAAGAVTGPLAALHFNRVSWLSIPVNIVVMPIFSALVMPASAIAGVLAPLGLGQPFAWAAGKGLDVMLAAAHWAQSVEAATAITASGAPITLGLALAGLAAACAFDKGRWRMSGALWAAAGAFWALSPTPLAWIGQDGRTLVFARGVVAAEPAFRGDYAREAVARRFGYGAGEIQPLDDVAACDAAGCVMERDRMLGRAPWRLAITRTAASLADDCGRADVVVSLPPPGRRFPSWPQRTVANDCEALALLPDRQRDRTVWVTPWGLRVTTTGRQRPWSAPNVETTQHF